MKDWRVAIYTNFLELVIIVNCRFENQVSRRMSKILTSKMKRERTEVSQSTVMTNGCLV